MHPAELRTVRLMSKAERRYLEESTTMSDRLCERNGLYVTSFAGGKSRGLCLAFDTVHQVAELTALDVAALVDDLTRWLDRTPYHRPGHDRRDKEALP